MRPGQTAPECNTALNVQYLTASGFNEAGADCPGMQICYITPIFGSHMLQ